MQPGDEIRVSPASEGGGRVPLTKREREILGLLAEGLSGAQIAGELVLSPETVRTHVRNAMAKLGASTRSQAVALALKGNEIHPEAFAASMPERGPSPSSARSADPAPGLAAMLEGLVALYDVDGGGVYLAEEDGLSLRRVATAAGVDGGAELAEVVALGDGPLGRGGRVRRRPTRASGRGPDRPQPGPADCRPDGRRRASARRDRAAPALEPPYRPQRDVAAAGFRQPRRRGRPRRQRGRGPPRPGDGPLLRLLVGGPADGLTEKSLDLGVERAQ
jgi:DNA-binding CsgD family transcriptional regulator